MKTKNIFIINADLNGKFLKEKPYKLKVRISIQDFETDAIYDTTITADKVIFHVEDNKTYIDELEN